ncbi:MULTISPECIES: carboxypeptidase-like regulatory domain-containing protein [unclassified Mucilaginibacter]|uniref:carboxypeptidase-like regulatory domain-containing protein n=1 Tax=unclassified Mucilaginibacter TaxID=2617802 RepID=UPI002AC8F5AF|nr:MULTISPECIES: carboxypeptidase-like regulatory domain-containing protein [unclassified Mucilaginibacter]MEB0250098.1 carboxypeptidase-like regulatory domain-containing protein [Mucilaginibacter sp. 5B2]MEB0263289.1 carboxypeptidase-like regulatory domain-containing protein [Mucilaginibacter sp. 10I4]MEB0278304.1 carboxypeptidase-like regulatory domain-containing protein [Mucilaginibacter sp. 10B2]MEB0301197.1 carboxypeptidase-like regulatory domain-containing protein [Mucilaginibacter sp. 5C
MKKLIGILFLLVSISAFSQQKENPLVQFTGVVYNADSTGVVVPYVTVTNKSSHNTANVTNYKGYFSFVVHEQDSLQFTAIGFAPVTVVIPENIKNKSYTVQVTIRQQMINLPMVRVFPWATTDEFRKDFVNAKIADDDLEIARKNISRTSIVAMTNTLPRDAQEIQSANAQYMHQDIVNQHSRVNPLLNPLAWGSLIKSITDGDSK